VWAFHGGRQSGETSSTSNGGSRSNHYNNRLYWYEGYSIDMHYIEGGTYCYCIYPWKSYNGTSYTYFTDPKGNGDITQSAYWKSFSTEQKKLLALVSIYGFPSQSAEELGVSADDDAYAATQCIIWEIVTGRRDRDGLVDDYTSNSFEKANGLSQAKNNVSYYLDKYMVYAYTGNGHTKGEATPALTAYYNILEAMSKHETVASFDEETLTLTYNVSTGKYTGSITDTNGQLANSSLVSSLPSGVSYSLSGNKITFTATKAVSLTTLTFSKNLTTRY
jgi:hypothetical protein